MSNSLTSEPLVKTTQLDSSMSKVAITELLRSSLVSLTIRLSICGHWGASFTSW
jgi:hypothetical protein